MFKTFCTLFVTLFFGISIQAQDKPQQIRGGLRIDDYSVSIGRQEYSEYRDQQYNVVRKNIWYANESDSQGYVRMNHMQNYEIRLGSSYYGRSDAKIEIDGKEIGVFRIEPNTAIIIERSPKDIGRLTFLTKGTREYFDAGLDRVSVTQRGLVKVTFYPERLRYRATNRNDLPHETSKDGKITTFGSQDMKSGGTGLTGRSGQLFRNASQITRDYGNSVTIHLRLVEKERFRASETNVRPLEDIQNYGRRNVPKNNIVPPPVER